MPGVGGNNNFFAWPYADSKVRTVQRRRAVIHGQCIARAGEPRKSILELSHDPRTVGDC